MSLCKPQNSKIRDRKLDDTDGPTDRRTNGPTDGPTDKATYRVACTRLMPILKNSEGFMKKSNKLAARAFIMGRFGMLKGASNCMVMGVNSLGDAT